MFNSIDSQEKIVLAKMAKLLTKYSNRVIKENGDGKSLLECSGLSSLVDEYNAFLTPYSFNGQWKNDNSTFNAGQAINEICYKISSNKKALSMFLNEFLSRIDKIDSEDICSFENYLEILGFKLDIKEKYDFYGTKYEFSLSNYIDGVNERQKDVSYLLNMINEKNNGLITYYEEAISTYGNAEYQGCISNCRVIFEKIFAALDTVNNDYAKGILISTKESVPVGSSTTPKMSSKGIFTYWLENKKGFNRYRLFVTMYSLMSALGSHGEEIPTKEDALLTLRVTEDILIWYFQQN
ncbi:MAG: hypothetical protein ACRC3Y_01240 [Romboutsia sp.]|uniref:hypothetical protein n=1 Tax=Romboutsia sp. TaxID=1965302 RepID=UPI003F3B9BDC